jgi:hypothetical protein
VSALDARSQARVCDSPTLPRLRMATGGLNVPERSDRRGHQGRSVFANKLLVSLSRKLWDNIGRVTCLQSLVCVSTEWRNGAYRVQGGPAAMIDSQNPPGPLRKAALQLRKELLAALDLPLGAATIARRRTPDGEVLVVRMTAPNLLPADHRPTSFRCPANDTCSPVG